jgi:Flp pilus assembly pilin Flp
LGWQRRASGIPDTHENRAEFSLGEKWGLKPEVAIGKQHYLMGIDLTYIRRLWRERSGATLIEYAFIVGIITSLVVVAVEAAGTRVEGMWARLLSALQ